MQVVIDIPEKLACEGFERPFTEEEKNTLIKAIGNGRLIDDMLDEIRSEILYLHDWAFDREEILSIIDKYKSERSDK